MQVAPRNHLPMEGRGTIINSGRPNTTGAYEPVAIPLSAQPAFYVPDVDKIFAPGTTNG